MSRIHSRPTGMPGRVLDHGRAAAVLGIGLLVAALLAPGSGIAQDETTLPEDPPPPPPPAPTDVEIARDLLGQLDAAKQDLDVLLAAADDVAGIERELMTVEALAFTEQFADLDSRLATVIGRLDPEAAVTDSVRQVGGRHLRYQITLYRNAWVGIKDQLIDLRARRDSTEPAGLSELESQITAKQELINTLLQLGVTVLAHLEALEIEAPRFASDVDHVLIERAEQLTGRLQLASQERDQIRGRIESARKAGSSEQEMTDERNRLGANEQRIAGIIESLDHTADLLARRGRDATRYRQLVIQTTGEVTDRILDPKVFRALAVDGVKNFGGWLRDQGPTWIVRMLILIATIFATRLIARLVWAVSQLFWRRTQASRLLSDLVGRMVGPMSTLLGLILGLWFLGVNPTTLLTGLGVLSIIVGLALQDSLGNLAAGMFILIYRPYDVDDAVSAGGVVGVVKAMGLANTTIVTFDNRRLYVPNRKIWQEVIENRSTESYRRVEATIRISYRQDLEAARQVIRDILADQDIVMEDPAPTVFVSNLDDSWVEIAVWPWASTENWWTATTELPGILKVGFEKAGIAVPYPRREVATIDGDADDRPRS